MSAFLLLPGRVRVVTSLGEQWATGSVVRRDGVAAAGEPFVLVLEFADHGPIEVHMGEASANALGVMIEALLIDAREEREKPSGEVP
jgi:hypothetical protein